MLENLDAILKNECCLTLEKPIIVGVSGGPDSLCLLDVLNRAGYPLVVAHFNHKLRPEADAEADAVEQLASRLSLTSVVESADVAAYARKASLTTEEAARTLRYRFLFAQARKHEAQAVAVGHTADDQVETVLMHFVRGAGLNGLKGMTYRTILPIFDDDIPIVRPLLDVWREQIVEYCASHGLDPHFDPSNTSADFFRNRLRNVLIPELESYNPRIREAIWRTAQALRGDHAVLSEVLDEVWQASLRQEGPGYLAFDAPALSSLSIGLQRNLIRRALERLNPDLRNVDFAVLERATAYMANPERPARIDLTGGIRLSPEGNRLYVLTRETDLPSNHWPQIVPDSGSFPFTIPGILAISPEWHLTGECENDPSLAWEQMRQNADPFQVWLDAALLTGPLEVCSRRSGDRFQPLGMDGNSLKITDFFINVKLPRRARDGWPLLCMGKTVVWVPGYRPAHPFRLTRTTQQVVHLSLLKIEPKKDR